MNVSMWVGGNLGRRHGDGRVLGIPKCHLGMEFCLSLPHLLTEQIEVPNSTLRFAFPHFSLSALLKGGP